MGLAVLLGLSGLALAGCDLGGGSDEESSPSPSASSANLDEVLAQKRARARPRCSANPDPLHESFDAIGFHPRARHELTDRMSGHQGLDQFWSTDLSPELTPRRRFAGARTA